MMILGMLFGKKNGMVEMDGIWKSEHRLVMLLRLIPYINAFLAGELWKMGLSSINYYNLTLFQHSF